MGVAPVCAGKGPGNVGDWAVVGGACRLQCPASHDLAGDGRSCIEKCQAGQVRDAPGGPCRASQGGHYGVIREFAYDGVPLTREWLLSNDASTKFGVLHAWLLRPHEKTMDLSVVLFEYRFYKQGDVDADHEHGKLALHASMSDGNTYQVRFFSHFETHPLGGAVNYTKVAQGDLNLSTSVAAPATATHAIRRKSDNAYCMFEPPRCELTGYIDDYRKAWTSPKVVVYTTKEFGPLGYFQYFGVPIHEFQGRFLKAVNCETRNSFTVVGYGGPKDLLKEPIAWLKFVVSPCGRDMDVVGDRCLPRCPSGQVRKDGGACGASDDGALCGEQGGFAKRMYGGQCLLTKLCKPGMERIRDACVQQCVAGQTRIHTGACAWDNENKPCDVPNVGGAVGKFVNNVCVRQSCKRVENGIREGPACEVKCHPGFDRVGEVCRLSVTEGQDCQRDSWPQGGKKVIRNGACVVECDSSRVREGDKCVVKCPANPPGGTYTRDGDRCVLGCVSGWHMAQNGTCAINAPVCTGGLVAWKHFCLEPCPTSPANGTVARNAGGTCVLSCNPGFEPNAGQTACVARRTTLPVPSISLTNALTLLFTSTTGQPINGMRRDNVAFYYPAQHVKPEQRVFIPEIGKCLLYHDTFKYSNNMFYVFVDMDAALNLVDGYMFRYVAPQTSPKLESKYTNAYYITAQKTIRPATPTEMTIKPCP